MATRIKVLDAVLEFNKKENKWEAIDPADSLIARHINAAYLPLKGFGSDSPNPGSESAHVVKEALQAEIISIDPTQSRIPGTVE